MGWFSAILGGAGAVVGPLVDAFKWGADKVSRWSERQDQLAQAKHEASVAEWRAKSEVAAFKVKADLEWDLKWADGAAASWKDEFMLVLWAFPLIALFIPGLRPFVMEGFEYLKGFHEDAPQWYMAGWAIIFAATFGFKQAATLMMPGRVAKLASALGSLDDDIPDTIAGKAQEAIDAYRS